MTLRKPYKQPMANNWWLKNSHYRHYMIREGTSVLVLVFAIELLAALFMLASGEPSWSRFINLTQTPGLRLLNGLLFIAVCWHTITWFKLAPKTMTIKLAGKKIPDKTIQLAHYVMLAGATVVIVIVLGGLL